MLHGSSRVPLSCEEAITPGVCCRREDTTEQESEGAEKEPPKSQVKQQGRRGIVLSAYYSALGTPIGAHDESCLCAPQDPFDLAATAAAAGDYRAAAAGRFDDD